tara:strand:+ start:766 stop:1008 length:243 start_codon:yes stop_codon:yes gene_type:complete
MKYFYFILILFLVTSFFIFTNLNPGIISLDLFFIKVEGISIGFSIIFSIFIGAIISLILQLPKLLRKNRKILSNKNDENP